MELEMTFDNDSGNNSEEEESKGEKKTASFNLNANPFHKRFTEIDDK